jgi:hypothetical protein
MTREQIDSVFQQVRSWPEADQEELAEVAREIEARRTGQYRTTPEEREAIELARQSSLVSEDELDAFWKARGVM